MNVGELCTREVTIAQRDCTLLEAAKLMRSQHVGDIIVVDRQDGRNIPVGIVTDRDIVLEVVAMELDASTLTLGDIMEPELMTAREEDSVFAAIEKMRYKGVRRLPVVSETGALLGIVSLSDLVEVLAEEMSHLARIITREQGLERQRRH
jgi:CBS domain-containing protein